MSRMAVMFPSSAYDASVVHEDYTEEYAACSKSQYFFPVLYNEHEYVRFGEELVVSTPAPVKSQYCILRGDPLDWGQYEDLLHTLRRSGYYPALECEGGPAWFGEGICHYSRADKLRPNRVQPYRRYEDHWNPGSYRWMPSLSAFESALPGVATNGWETLKDENGDPVVFCEVDYETIDEIAAHFGAELKGENNRSAPFWFEKYEYVAEEQGAPIVWRAYYYMGRLIYLCPRFRVKNPELLPGPSRTVMDDASSWGFNYFDIALTRRGEWKVVKGGQGEYAKVPEGGSAEKFYERLESELKRGRDVPEWSWCLVGDIVQSRPFGEERRTVFGTKHFKPGTKVYIVNAFWGGGGDRCTALGIPRYTDHLIGVHMDTTLIRNFRCEKVDDKDVLRAMFTNRLTEEFERPRKTAVETTYWDDSEWSRRRIEDFAESANRIMAEGGEF